MRRGAGVVVGLLVVLGGCTPDPALAPESPKSTAPPASPTAVAGGCGDTRLWTAAAPDWTASAGAPGQLPYALSHEGNVYAGLFANPLLAEPPTGGPNNKILWIVREPRDGQALRLTLRRLDGSGEAVTQSEVADSGPGEIYPSIVDVPAAGCWAITAEWAGHRATLELPWI